MDSALQTFVTFFYKEQKQFSGGDFWITDFNHKIEIEKRQVVWEAELEDDLLNQYNMIFGAGIQIVSGDIPRNIPTNSQISVVGN